LSWQKHSVLLAEIANNDLSRLLPLWTARDPELWASTPELWRALSQRLLALGEPLLAYDVAAQGRELLAGDLRLTQLFALALARLGSTDKANTLVRELIQAGHDDEETLGMLASTCKDLGLKATESSECRRLLAEARNLYSAAHKRTGGYWTGINAATLSLLIDEPEVSRDLARTVRKQCVQQVNAGVPAEEQFWIDATLGEAALLLGEIAEAQGCYARARQAGPMRYADLGSARRNARLIVDHFGQDWSVLQPLFDLPKVAVCAGHMIDAPQRRRPRFPQALEQRVKLELARSIQELNVGFGYASAACGTDILFLEALMEAGKEFWVVLPYAPEEFRRDSVDLVPEANWGRRFELLLQKATQVTVVSKQRLLGGPASLQYGNRYLRGLAGLRAQRLGTELVGIAVWDGVQKSAPGGTCDAIAQWESSGLAYRLIEVPSVGHDCPPDAESDGSADIPGSASPAEFRPQICGLLFADAVGFSKLKEEQIPPFVQRFLGGIAQVMAASQYQPLFKNTWGDGLYFVFPSAEAAGGLALELREWMRHARFGDAGLPPQMMLRIGLHAGPVYATLDPVLERINYVGTHVSRAARIEPITPPGEVYASEAFAALSMAEGVQGFRCEYVGQTPQAKGYGTLPTYLVRDASKAGWL
jgi:class 3 adenylate cyclase